MKQRIAILFLALLLLGCTGDFEHIDAEAYRTAPYTPAPTDAGNPDELPTSDVMTNAPQPTETPVPQPLRERYQIPETVRFDRQAGLLHIAGNRLRKRTWTVCLPRVSENAKRALIPLKWGITRAIP